MTNNLGFIKKTIVVKICKNKKFVASLGDQGSIDYYSSAQNPFRDDLRTTRFPGDGNDQQRFLYLSVRV